MCNLMFDTLYTAVLISNITIIIINISPNKFTKKSLIVFSIINYFTIFLLHFIKYDIVMFLAIFINSIIYLYIISKKKYQSIVIAAFINIIFAVSDSIAGFFAINVFKLNYHKLIMNLNIYFIVGLSMVLFSYIISKVAGVILNEFLVKDNNLNDYLKENVLIINYMIVAIIVIIINLVVYKYILIRIDRNIIFLTMILLVVILISSIILLYFSNKSIKIKLEQKHKNEEYQQLKEYTSMLENTENSLRRFKHDYLNILNTLGSYIESEDIIGLKQFYKNEVLPESNKIINKNKYLFSLQHIKIIPLKGLISSKIINANSNNIKTKIEILEDICSVSMGIIDICRVIGILIDNAIEGAELTDDKNIHIAIVKNECATIFVIKNSCTRDTPKVYEIYQKDFSTKGDGRGIGLKTVRNIIDNKYSNIVLNTKIKNLVFKQELVIYN